MISTVLTTATTYVRNYTQVLIMVYRELQVIFSFCIFSVFPSFFHKHIIFTTENKGPSLLRPGLGHGDTCLLGPASSVHAHHPHSAASVTCVPWLAGGDLSSSPSLGPTPRTRTRRSRVFLELGPFVELSLLWHKKTGEAHFVGSPLRYQ